MLKKMTEDAGAVMLFIVLCFLGWVGAIVFAYAVAYHAGYHYGVINGVHRMYCIGLGGQS